MIAFLPVFFPFGCALILGALSKYMPHSAKFLAFAGTSLALVSTFTLQLLIQIEAVQIIHAPDIFTLTIASFIAFFATLAAISALREEAAPRFYFNLLISAAFALGAVLADNFVIMLFFWEGLLVTLYLFLLPYNSRTATKAFLINAAGDVILLTGICLFYVQTKTLTFADISATNLGCAGLWAFILMFTGAVAKAGAFPFQSWIAPAAKDSSFTFMAMLPASTEKLLAVFLMGKMLTVLFPILPASARIFACCLGATTVIIAAIRMLPFKDLRELLGWSVVMQIGLLVIGAGARNMLAPADDIAYIANHGIFKAALLACAFFAAGALHYGLGGTSLKELRGYAKQNPLITVILLVSALGLAGTSLVDMLFVPAAVLADSFAVMPILVIIPAFAALVTVYTFTKVFFAMFIKGGKKAGREVIFTAVTLMSFIPVLFFTFGFEFSMDKMLAPHFAGINLSWVSLVSLIILAAGIILAAIIKQPAYDIKPDTYNIVKAGLSALAAALFKADRFMDKLIDVWPSSITKKISVWISKSHQGNIPQYVLWAVLGIFLFIVLAAKGGIK
jgi:NADH-quinone oxidoreductase subunit L